MQLKVPTTRSNMIQFSSHFSKENQNVFSYTRKKINFIELDYRGATINIDEYATFKSK